MINPTCADAECPLLLDYCVDTQEGSSGSGVFDGAWRLVGIHLRGHAGRGRAVAAAAVCRLVLDGRVVTAVRAATADRVPPTEPVVEPMLMALPLDIQSRLRSWGAGPEPARPKPKPEADYYMRPDLPPEPATMARVPLVEASPNRGGPTRPAPAVVRPVQAADDAVPRWGVPVSPLGAVATMATPPSSPTLRVARRKTARVQPPAREPGQRTAAAVVWASAPAELEVLDAKFKQLEVRSHL
jgi:hypothetical protein